jgi:hypothetical protein
MLKFSALGSWATRQVKQKRGRRTTAAASRVSIPYNIKTPLGIVPNPAAAIYVSVFGSNTV